MAIKRRWLQSALEETKKPLPKMPWQARKMASAMPRVSTLLHTHEEATA
ncbi:hypothetical protein [Oceaniglobus ichthyenteri]|nr:hypothetical protein [Oceaniglobus ichthyenteri]